VSFDIGEAAALLGRTETREAAAHSEPARLLQATLDREIDPFETGAPLPLLWHWLYFPPLIRQSRLGEDGHTRDSSLLPVVPFLPRRMWAGSRLRSQAPLRIGDRLTRRSEVTSLTPKIGNSGRLLFVTLRHTLAGSSGGSVVEEQDIALREAAGRSTPLGNPVSPAAFDFEHVVTPTPTLLFRFSALTFNAHRIHFDHPYATQVEGYEGLVVHGPLIAVLMLDLVDRVSPGAFVSSFEFKAVNPAFVPHPLAVRAKTTETGFSLRVESAGHIASSGTATAPRHNKTTIAT
jgi:3-methylfumaryl-CoA hydratase